MAGLYVCSNIFTPLQAKTINVKTTVVRQAAHVTLVAKDGSGLSAKLRLVVIVGTLGRLAPSSGASKIAPMRRMVDRIY